MKLARFPSEVGITPETIPGIERSNTLLFEKLNTLFGYYPYVLGGRPSVADCALMETIHAHLGRDPYAATIMKTTALVDFLRLIGKDFGAQFAATAKAYEDWLTLDPNRPEGAIISLDGAGTNRQAMGKMESDLQGVTIKRDAWPDVINMFSKWSIR